MKFTGRTLPELLNEISPIFKVNFAELLQNGPSFETKKEWKVT